MERSEAIKWLMNMALNGINYASDYPTFPYSLSEARERNLAAMRTLGVSDDEFRKIVGNDYGTREAVKTYERNADGEIIIPPTLSGP